MSAARPRVVFVMVECVCAEDADTAVGVIAEQWAQDLRFRAVGRGAETTDARSVVLDGTLATLADTLRMAAEKATT